ncbi:MAG: hypothetical protein KGM15_07380 [Pseudomonadota bacterium]|nr:hypothetical protein [Pseudomonadota bacterium]
MTDIARQPSLLQSVLAAKHHFAVFAVVALVAAVYQFGYPVVIALALTGAFTAIAMMVGLTALDLVDQAKSAPRARNSRRAVAQPA